MTPKVIYFILASLSLLLLLRLFTFYTSIKNYSEGEIITWKVTVLDQPKLMITGQQLSVSMPNSQRVTLKLKLIPQVLYGDQVAVKGKLEYFRTDDGNIIAFMNYPEFKILEKGSTSNILFKLRENIIYFFNSNLPQTYSALMLGIVFGIKEEMPVQFYLNLQKVGLMHVIAASGMNITMLGGFLSLFFALFLKRQLAIIFTVLGIIFYAVLAGLEPSIVRASLMGIVVLLAQITGRQNNSFLALFFAGFIMLMRSPSLIFDVGFQLSFLATFGLIYLRPIFILIPGAKRIVTRSIIGEDLITTLTAQIMTLPILLVNFGSYSLWSIPVNAIVLWTVPILMILGGIAVILGLLIEPIGRLFLYFSVPFLLYFTKIVDVFSTVGGQVNIKTLPIFLICGYYLIILSLILFQRNKNKILE